MWWLIWLSLHAAGASRPGCTEALTRSAHVLWYPSASQYVLGHIDLAYEGYAWSGDLWLAREHDMATVERAVLRGGRPFLKIELRLTEPEYQNMGQYLEDHQNQMTYQFCSSSAAKILACSTRLSLPRRWMHMPVTMVLYLLLAKGGGYERVGQIKWYGPETNRGYLKPWALGFVAPFVEGAIVGFVILNIALVLHL